MLISQFYNVHFRFLLFLWMLIGQFQIFQQLLSAAATATHVNGVKILSQRMRCDAVLVLLTQLWSLGFTTPWPLSISIIKMVWGSSIFTNLNISQQDSFLLLQRTPQIMYFFIKQQKNVRNKKSPCPIPVLFFFRIWTKSTTVENLLSTT